MRPAYGLTEDQRKALREMRIPAWPMFAILILLGIRVSGFGAEYIPLDYITFVLAVLSVILYGATIRYGIRWIVGGTRWPLPRDRWGSLLLYIVNALLTPVLVYDIFEFQWDAFGLAAITGFMTLFFLHFYFLVLDRIIPLSRLRSTQVRGERITLNDPISLYGSIGIAIFFIILLLLFPFQFGGIVWTRALFSVSFLLCVAEYARMRVAHS